MARGGLELRRIVLSGATQSYVALPICSKVGNYRNKTMPSELTWRNAIDKVLSDAGAPLHAKEITDRIITEGLRHNVGATPTATVGAQISASIKHDGESSPYVRVDKGTFALRSCVTPSALHVPPSNEATEATDTEEQYDVISSFGMFWRRHAVEWTSSPRLLGMQSMGSTPVDFNRQRGVYLLYDVREVIYVGRTTERPLGRRLTSTRLTAFRLGGTDSLGLGFSPSQSLANSWICRSVSKLAN